jgi:hypothetical protein
MLLGRIIWQHGIFIECCLIQDAISRVVVTQEAESYRALTRPVLA